MASVWRCRRDDARQFEARLDVDGRELLRRLFRSHLDLRALREERLPEVAGGDGGARSHVRATERPLTTLFGAVWVGRLRYGGRGLTSLFPADLALNLPQEAYSHGPRRRAAELAATVSFDETVRSIDAHTGGHVPARQTQELVRRAATDFDAFCAAVDTGGPPVGWGPWVPGRRARLTRAARGRRLLAADGVVANGRRHAVSAGAVGGCR